MTLATDLTAFLERNNVSLDDWEKSKCDWAVLSAIADHHQESHELLRETAEAFARIIQKFPAVHSVRWRVKDVDHLLEKIVRKRMEGSDKYAEINVENYQRLVTDLVGIRALHLFKDECFDIDTALKSTWKMAEAPVAYFREGDDQTLRALFEERGLEAKDHKAGYRSVHYVLPSSLTQREIFVEVQVRTIFEEGWSEIDHRVRYPNYHSSPQVDYFLTIFNRTAGSADEMGSFVRNLALAFRVAEATTERLENERDEAIEQMTQFVAQLSHAEEKGQRQSETIKKLEAQLGKLSRAVRAAKTPELPSWAITAATGHHGIPDATAYLASSASDSWSKMSKMIGNAGIAIDAKKLIDAAAFVDTGIAIYPDTGLIKKERKK